MRIVLRALVGLIGLMGCLVAVAIWANPERPAAELGLEVASALGVASLRADLAGFFGGVGVLAAAAAIRGEARLLTAPLLLICLALMGRGLTVALDGFTPAMAQPMVIEAVLIAVLGAGRRFIGSRP